MRPSRRQFLRTSIIGGAILSIAGIAYVQFGSVQEHVADNYSYTFLSGKDRALFAKLIPVVLEGTLPAQGLYSIDRVLEALDRSLQTPALAIQKELRQLLDLLQLPATRCVLAGIWTPWHEASNTEIAAFLNRWKDSRLSLFSSAYVGLTSLVKAAWFGLPESFAGIGYAGPLRAAIEKVQGVGHD